METALRWAQTQTTLKHSVDHYAASANRRHSLAPAYHVGQKVWLSTLDLPLWVESKEQAPKFIGLFPNQRVISQTAMRLRFPHSILFHSTFHVSKLKLVHESPLSSVFPPIPPLRLHGGPVLSIWHLVRCRHHGGRLKYLVDWKGDGPEERSWVPACHILDPDLITDFHSCHLDQPITAPLRGPHEPVHTSSLPVHTSSLPVNPQDNFTVEGAPNNTSSALHPAEEMDSSGSEEFYTHLPVPSALPASFPSLSDP